MLYYTQKVLLRKPLGVRLRALCARCVIDGFAKMPLQASIFALWYNKKAGYAYKKFVETNQKAIAQFSLIERIA